MTSTNLITVNEGTYLRMEQILKKHKIEKLPVVSKENILVGLITLEILQNILQSRMQTKINLVGWE